MGSHTLLQWVFQLRYSYGNVEIGLKEHQFEGEAYPVVDRIDKNILSIAC